MGQGDDQEFVRKLLRRRDKTEALAWLEGNERRNVGEMSHRASLGLVRRLYTFGAIEIVAVDISANAGFESTDTLIATLPAEPAKRRKLFEWKNEHTRLMGYEPDVDQGEEHLFIWFD